METHPRQHLWSDDELSFSHADNPYDDACILVCLWDCFETQKEAESEISVEPKQNAFVDRSLQILLRPSMMRLRVQHQKITLLAFGFVLYRGAFLYDLMEMLLDWLQVISLQTMHRH